LFHLHRSVSPVSEFSVPAFRNTCIFCAEVSEHCLLHLHRSLTYEDGTECSETAAHKIQSPGIPTYEDGKSVPKRRHRKFRRRGITQKMKFLSKYQVFFKLTTLAGVQIKG
jgi:hypothetical protein